jgi:phosphopantetheine--protein transferase-like protein
MTTGIDMEEVNRFKHLLEKKPLLLKNLFSEYEWHYASQKNQAQTLAGIWCAKEAVVKALYAQGTASMIRDVHINHNNLGVPQVQSIAGLEHFNIGHIQISISHTMKHAIAVCFIVP